MELTVVTDNYLTAAERKRLNSAHAGIVTIIPEVKDGLGLTSGNKKNIDLTRSMEELFSDYFRQAKGHEPNAELMALFTELLAEGDEF